MGQMMAGEGREGWVGDEVCMESGGSGVWMCDREDERWGESHGA